MHGKLSSAERLYLRRELGGRGKKNIKEAKSSILVCG